VGRPATYFGGGVVAHLSLADPVCGSLSDTLADAASDSRVHREGVYLCIEGPQFSTRAESALWRSRGADVVGMTNVPEARLAREAELCYATLALPTDYDCWRASTEEVRVADVIAVLKANVEKALRILARALEVMDPSAPCSCHRVLDRAILTRPEGLDAKARLRLHALLARRVQPAKHTTMEVRS
jgi:5'-methylthioadenosine phosphorylase